LQAGRVEPRKKRVGLPKAAKPLINFSGSGWGPVASTVFKIDGALKRSEGSTPSHSRQIRLLTGSAVFRGHSTREALDTNWTPTGPNTTESPYRKTGQPFRRKAFSCQRRRERLPSFPRRSGGRSFLERLRRNFPSPGRGLPGRRTEHRIAVLWCENRSRTLSGKRQMTHRLVEATSPFKRKGR